MVTEEQIRHAMELIAEKKWNASVLMYDMQNFSTVDHNNADLHEWLAGMTSDGYSALIERLNRM